MRTGTERRDCRANGRDLAWVVTMAERDLYAVLGVPRDASPEAVKKAFRAQALKHHPDRNPGDKKAEEAFKALNNAHEVLGDPKKRKLYDEFGEVGLREGFNPDAFRQWQGAGAGAGGGPNLEDLFGAQGGGGGAVDFSELFGHMFQGGRGGPFAGAGGGAGGRTRSTRGRDLESDLLIDLPLAMRGGEVTLTSRGEPIRVRIPQGTREGGRLRIPGKGLPSAAGGHAGDLLLEVKIEPHPYFWIEDDELHVRLPVALAEAYLGTKATIPTPSGDVTLRVPPKTVHGARLRVRGKGVPGTAKRPAGDLTVHVEVAPLPAGPEVDEAIALLAKVQPDVPRDDLKF